MVGCTEGNGGIEEEVGVKPLTCAVGSADVEVLGLADGPADL